MMKLKLTNLTNYLEQNLSCVESATTIKHVSTVDPKNFLHAPCTQSCGEFPILFQSTLGRLKGYFLD